MALASLRKVERDWDSNGQSDHRHGSCERHRTKYLQAIGACRPHGLRFNAEADDHDEHGDADGGAEGGKRGADLRTIAFDVSSDASINSAIDAIVAENNRLDVIVHNARQVLYGPAEAFTPAQLAALYDTNVLSAHRLNRAALPQLRKQGHGLLIWVSSSSARGGSVPFLGAYASSKAALDALALGYAGELARWGVETTLVVPSALGPGHYIRSGRPLDTVRAEEYADGPTADLSEIGVSALAQLSAMDRTRQDVATAVADICLLYTSDAADE